MADQQQPNISKEPPQPKSTQSENESNDLSTDELIVSIIRHLKDDKKDNKKSEELKKDAIDKTKLYLKNITNKHKISDDYNLIILYDEMQMVQQDADLVYASITKFKDKKPILMILKSNGGQIGPAYLIGKLLREYSNGPLEIAVPRAAKSAATLICCAADLIHMGSLSELGPIDPQFNELPVLGLKIAIKHIAELVSLNPSATDLFANYMHKSIPPMYLGYYERIAESAVQYAERLLSTHKDKLSNEPSQIAHDLVYKYYDHGFVIDKQEARRIFGDNIIKDNSIQYQLGNDIYEILSLISWVTSITNNRFYFIGSLESEPKFINKE